LAEPLHAARPEDASDGVRFTVAVCTFNRAGMLRGCLEDLVALAPPAGGHEILVVDNNSSDATREVVEGFMSDAPELRYLFEPEQGLSHARNAACRAARGEYVVFFDDECRIPFGYLRIADEVVDQRAPSIFGGLIVPRFTTPPPPWYLDGYGGNGRLGTEARSLASDEFLAGGNIAVRRSVAEELGGFDPDLGMIGGRIRFGEETDLQLRHRAAHPDDPVHYDPRLVVEHIERAEKYRLRFTALSRFHSGMASSRMFVHRLPALPRPLLAAAACGIIVVLALWLVASATLGVLVRPRSRYPHPGNYAHERLLPRVERLATAVGILRDVVRCP